jgi:hypothetical protein
MINLRTSGFTAAIICVATRPGFAIPLTSGLIMKADPIVQDVRVVCDEYGSCWDTGPGYGYGYRSPNKWERKGFCPPGQAKKGNC